MIGARAGGLLDGSKPPDLSPIPPPVVTVSLPAPITRRASGRRGRLAAATPARLTVCGLASPLAADTCEPRLCTALRAYAVPSAGHDFMMHLRISPLGIFGWQSTPEELAKLAAADAALTHPNTICQQVSGLYAAAIAAAVREGHGPQTLYERIIGWAIAWNVDPAIAERIKLAQTYRPPEYSRQMGWGLIAFHNALYELLHVPKLEEGIIATVHCGGDTDTNAAICGALLGAVYGRNAVPQQWVEKIVTCRPGAENARRPRPTEYWPHDALGLAEQLVEAETTKEAR